MPFVSIMPIGSAKKDEETRQMPNVQDKAPDCPGPFSGLLVWTSPEFGRTVDHLYSFNLDQSRPLDHWSGLSGALVQDCREKAHRGFAMNVGLE